MAFLRSGRDLARLLLLALSLLSLGLAAPGCGRKEDANNPIVARVGDTLIRKWDFVSAVEKAPRDTWPPLDSLDHAGRLEFVKTMVSKQLLELEAQRRFAILPPDQEFLARKAERDLVLATLASELAPARRLSPDDIEECRRTITPIYSTHALVLDNAARAKEVAAGQWTDGTFNDLVRRETLEMKVEETLGNDFLRDIRAPQFVPEALPALENVKEGTILGPYRMQVGWVVYRIARITIPPDSAQADTSGLAETCGNLHRSLALSKAVDRVLEKEPVVYNDENIAWLQKQYSERFMAVHESLKVEILLHKGLLIPALSESDRARELARVSGQSYTAGQFLDELSPHPIPDYPNILHRGSIRLLVEEFINDGVLWREAERRGLPKRREIADAVARKRGDIALDYLVDKSLFDEAQKGVSEGDLQDFYKNNIGDFMSKGKLEMEVIYLNDPRLGSKLTTMLKRGEPFPKVAAAARAGDPSAEAVPKTGRFDWNDQPELYDFAREFEVGGASGPVRMKNGRLAVYRVIYHGPPEPRAFEEVRHDVLQSVTFLEREKLLDKLLTQLRTTYPVQIEENKL